MIVFDPKCKRVKNRRMLWEFFWKAVRQNSSSASLIGGMRMLLDLDWLPWLRLAFEVLIGVVLTFRRFSGSSVNHVFFLFVPALVAVDAVGRGYRVH